VKRQWLKVSLCIWTILLIVPCANAAAPNLADVSESWIYGYDIVSAFPWVYNTIPTEENADIDFIYHFQEGGYVHPFYQRRVEIFYTGGDWMQYGLVYFITDAQQEITVKGKVIHYWPDGPRAYFIPEMSTTDFEGGEIPPRIDPFNAAQRITYLRYTFLNNKGWVHPRYKPLPGP
jgi:hypothetical protein